MENFTIIFLLLGALFLLIGSGLIIKLIPEILKTFRNPNESEKPSIEQQQGIILGFLTGIILFIVGVVCLYFGIITLLDPSLILVFDDPSYGDYDN